MCDLAVNATREARLAREDASSASLSLLGRETVDASDEGQANSVEMSLGDTIRRARETYGWSQQEVARHLGVSKAAVGHWETGFTVPGIETRIDLADLLNIRFSDLLPEAKGPVAVVRDRDLVKIVALLEQVPPVRRASMFRIIAVLAKEYLPTPEAAEQLEHKTG